MKKKIVHLFREIGEFLIMDLLCSGVIYLLAKEFTEGISIRESIFRGTVLSGVLAGFGFLNMWYDTKKDLISIRVISRVGRIGLRIWNTVITRIGDTVITYIGLASSLYVGSWAVSGTGSFRSILGIIAGITVVHILNAIPYIIRVIKGIPMDIYGVPIGNPDSKKLAAWDNKGKFVQRYSWRISADGSCLEYHLSSSPEESSDKWVKIPFWKVKVLK